MTNEEKRLATSLIKLKKEIKKRARKRGWEIDKQLAGAIEEATARVKVKGMGTEENKELAKKIEEAIKTGLPYEKQYGVYVGRRKFYELKKEMKQAVIDNILKIGEQQSADSEHRDRKEGGAIG